MSSSRKAKVFSLSLAEGVLLIVNVASGMVFARALSVSDYGTYLQTFLAYNFAAPLLTMGLPSALYYFLPGAKERQKGLVLENILLLFAAGTIFSLFLILGGTDLLAKRFSNPELSRTLRWLIPYPLFTFPVVLGAVLVIKEKVTLNAVYNATTGIILTLALITAAVTTSSYEAPIIVRIIMPILILPVALYLTFKHLPGKWQRPRLNSMLKILKFAVPLGLASVFGTLTLQLANIIVSFLCTTEEFAVYAIGAKEIPLVSIITGSIAVVVMADMSKKCKEGDLKSALELFRKASIMSASFLLPIMVFLMIYADSFIDVLYTSKYAESVFPFRIYLFYLPVRIVYYGAAFISLGKSKAVLYRSLISLVLTAIFCYLLTYWIGFTGAAIATVLVSYIWAIPYNLITLSKEFGCKPFYIIPFKKLGNILALSLIAGIISAVFLLLFDKSLIAISSGFILFGIIYISIAYYFLPETREIISPVLNKLTKYTR